MDSGDELPPYESLASRAWAPNKSCLGCDRNIL